LLKPSGKAFQPHTGNDFCSLNIKPSAMKLFYLLLLTTLFLSSCRKWQPQSRIVGEWKLTDAERRRFLDYDNITTGYENGRFIFNESGSAEYREGTLVMTGNWFIRNRQGVFVEDNATNERNELVIRLNGGGRNLDWWFDDVNFGLSGNRMRAFIYSGSPNYRYLFEKQ
jgi:hypothetical protein